MQVIPTVGVDGEDGEKAREKMQKHFRLLGEGEGRGRGAALGCCGGKLMQAAAQQVAVVPTVAPTPVSSAF